MIHFKELDKSIEKFAELISNELEQRKFYDKKEFFTYAKIRLSFAIAEILKLETVDLEKQKNGLVQEYLSDIPNYKKVKIQNQLSSLNIKIKERNIINSAFENQDEYQQLKQYVRVKIGDAPLRDFYDNWIKTPLKSQTGRRKIINK